MLLDDVFVLIGAIGRALLQTVALVPVLVGDRVPLVLPRAIRCGLREPEEAYCAPSWSPAWPSFCAIV
jgi:hypothetical protein